MHRRQFVLGLAAAATEAVSPIDSVRNPVLSYPDWSIKDATMVAHSGAFYIFFDAAFEDRGRMRFHLIEVMTTDFQSFSKPLLMLDGVDEGWIGMASPEIFFAAGKYFLTYNSWGDKPSQPNELFVRTSSNLQHWSQQQPLAANLTTNLRAIDAALAVRNGVYYLVFKEAQKTRIATAESLKGDFRWIGDGYPRFHRGTQLGPWHENYQFFRYKSVWHMMTTADDHDPFVYKMSGDGSKEEHWLEWVEGFRIEIDRQSFNNADRANSASIVLGMPARGPQYILYAGNNDKKSYRGRGWNRLGLAVPWILRALSRCRRGRVL